MANIVRNHLVITGTEEEIKSFFAKTDWVFDLKRLIPIIENTDDWKVKNWGCRDNVDSVEIINKNKNYVEYLFSTPWTPPQIAIKTLSFEFPSLHFEGEFISEDIIGSYYIRNGQEFDLFIQENYDKERIKKNRKIKRSSFLKESLGE